MKAFKGSSPFNHGLKIKKFLCRETSNLSFPAEILFGFLRNSHCFLHLLKVDGRFNDGVGIE